MNSKRYTELKKLSSYSPFLNIVEQSISTLKAAIKADISRQEVQQQMNNREEARDRTGASSNSAPAISVTAKCWHNKPGFHIVASVVSVV